MIQIDSNKFDYPPEGLTGFLRAGRPEKKIVFVRVRLCGSVAKFKANGVFICVGLWLIKQKIR